jgi:hypothetical protein
MKWILAVLLLMAFSVWVNWTGWVQVHGSPPSSIQGMEE